MSPTFATPPRLRRGDTVAVISLSDGLLQRFPAAARAGVRNLEERFGLRVVTTPNAARDSDWLYRHPEARADDLHWALENPEVAGIVSAIGGYESVRILPFVDAALIRRHPKILLGFSDTTVTQTAFLRAGVGAFYGPSLLAGLAELGAFPEVEASLHRTLFQPDPPGALAPASGWTEEVIDWDAPDFERRANEPRALRPGGWRWLQGRSPAAGHLIGGCVEVLEMLKGTRWWPEPELWRGAVLLLETSEEVPAPENVQYWLRNYASQGILQELAGLLLGRPRGYDDAKRERLFASTLMVLAECGREDLPVVADLDAAHTLPTLVLPLGRTLAIDPQARTLTLTDPAVR